MDYTERLTWVLIIVGVTLLLCACWYVAARGRMIDTCVGICNTVCGLLACAPCRRQWQQYKMRQGANAVERLPALSLVAPVSDMAPAPPRSQTPEIFI